MVFEVTIFLYGPLQSLRFLEGDGLWRSIRYSLCHIHTRMSTFSTLLALKCTNHDLKLTRISFRSTEVCFV